MDESFRIGRFRGIPVGAHWSLLVVVALVTLGLAGGRYPQEVEGRSEVAYLIAGLVTAVLFFGSILVHELGHAVVARAAGLPVEGITLWLFGGVTRIQAEAETPGDELKVAAVGPALSLAIAALAGIVAVVLGDGAGLTRAVAEWLARINVVLAVFNLLPAAPLDGGRVLRAAVWRWRGDRSEAAIVAARAGRALAYLLVALGIAQVLFGAGFGGFWLAFLGWYLLNAARLEEQQVVVRDALEGVLVRDVMTPEPVTAPGWVTVETFIEEHLMRQRFSTFPVERFDGSPGGLVTLARIKTVPRERRHEVRVEDVACARDQVPTAAPDEPLLDLLERLSDANGCSDGRALVVDGDHVCGIISPSDVARVLDRRQLQ